MSRVGLGKFINHMTQTHPDPLFKKKFMTRPNPPTPKNRPNLMGWVGSGWFWWVGIRCTPLAMGLTIGRRSRVLVATGTSMGLTAGYKEMMLPSAPVCVN